MAEKSYYSTRAPSYQKNKEDYSERKNYERREQSFGYSAPLKSTSFESGKLDDGFVTKQNNFYESTDKSNPEGEVTEKRTVERRETNFTYDGPSQKQFHPKYILGMPATTMGRLKGLNESMGRHDDIDVSIVNNYGLGKLSESPDLQSPRLINILSRRTDSDLKSFEDMSISRSKKTFLDSVKKNNLEPNVKASSPARSMTPTSSYSSRQIMTRSPMRTESPSDDYEETHRMTFSTPDHDGSNEPKIRTDTTSKFSRKTLRSSDGQTTGKVESTETTSRTKSKFTESEVMYPSGKKEYHAKTLPGGSIIIPIKDTNNNKRRPQIKK